MTRSSIEVAGHRRTYLLVPPANRREDAPLLLALHGSTQRGATLRAFSGRTLDALADRIGADLVYPDGFRRGWNDARRSVRNAAQRRGIDDVAFVRAVAARFGRPVVAVGYSNGGQLVHRLLHEAHGLLAGAAVIAAGLPVEDDFALAGVAPDPVPLLLLHGTADPVVPYGGGPTRLLGRPRGEVRSAPATAAHYAPDARPSAARLGDVERTRLGHVLLLTQHGTGHVVPNRVTAPPFVGPSHHDVDTGEEIQRHLGL